MRAKLLILFLLFSSLLSFGRGSNGNYFIIGKAYNSQGQLLKNQTIKVTFNNQIQEITTDNNGNYELKIYWESTCPSAKTKKEKAEANEKLNPKWIKVSYNGKEIKIKNKWEKYAELFPDDKKSITRKLNLKF